MALLESVSRGATPAPSSSSRIWRIERRVFSRLAARMARLHQWKNRHETAIAKAAEAAKFCGACKKTRCGPSRDA